jgi:hypothetical protein
MTVADWIANFKINFPEFATITDNNGNDVTSATLTYYLYLAMDLLPQGAIEYFSVPRMTKVVDYMVAHLLQYYDILNNYSSAKSLMRTTSSMSANGLSISYSDIAKLRGEMFSSLNDFLNATAYGRTVSIFLNQMAGSCGGFLV